MPGNCVMILRLRPVAWKLLGRREPLLRGARCRSAQRPIRRRLIGGPAARRLIDHVHRIALAHEIQGPALAPVRRGRKFTPVCHAPWIMTTGSLLVFLAGRKYST